MIQEVEEQNGQKLVPQIDLLAESEMDETWQTLADCKISLPLARLVQLVPRFTEKVATLVTQKGTNQVLVNTTSQVTG